MVEAKRYFPMSVLLSEEQYEGLRRLRDEGRYKSISEAVRAAIDAFLEREGVSAEESGEK